MELVGERWSLLIVRELMMGGLRFSDLRANLPGISAKVLTERLNTLEEAGILVKRKLARPASTQLYELTEWGYFAEVPIMELGRWAARSPEHDPTLPLSAVGLMLSFRTMFVAGKADGVSLDIGFDIAGETFVNAVADGKLTNRRAELDGVETIVTAQAAPQVAAVVYGGVSPEEAELQIDGDRETMLRFAGMFQLPPKIGG